MAIINVLDKQTAELIAAGEVVEKPASVVKELVENSIDAAAKNIVVDIENGGIRKILVQDDGSGIDSEYIKTAFIRHATSKISSKDDLDAIGSLGFRGEALASIASVSKLSLISKTHDQDFGIEIKLCGGEEESFCVKPFVDGSRFIIKDLFYNTPARMKFLKKDATEAGYIQDILTNLSLSKPDISFTFKKDNKEIFSTIGDGVLKNTIASLFGTSFAGDITPVEFSDGKYTVSGYATHAHASRQSRNMQFAFVNGRYVKNKTIIAAIENAYKGSVMAGKFPGYVLNIKMPFEIVDVNVHPTKTEVRFANDGEVFSAIYRAVKIALSNDQEVRHFSFTQKQPTTFFVQNDDIKQEALKEITQEQPQPSGNNIDTNNTDNAETKALKMNISKAPQSNAPRYMDFSNDSSVNELRSDKNITPYLSEYSNNTQFQEIKTPQDISQINSNPPQKADDAQCHQEMYLRVIGELFSTYILCESEDGMVMIDKHAAHERLIYEKLKVSQNCDNQMLLSPITVKLSAREKDAILENIDLLTQQGFLIEDFGHSGIVVRATPMNITGEDPQSLVSEIAYNLSENNKQSLSEKQEWILHSVACRSAIKAGDKATNLELVELVKAIKSEKIPLFCPHGRPVIITITKKELERQFGRS